jgi:hypothetical protein
MGSPFSSSPLIVFVGCGSGGDEEPSGGGILRLIQIRFDNVVFRLTRLLDLSPTGLLNLSRVFVC